MITKSKHVLKAIALLINNNDGGYGVKNGIIKNWDNSATQPSESEINAKIAELDEEYDALEYARNRQAEYPSIADLVVALYDTDDKSAVEAKRAAVKEKYPKP